MEDVAADICNPATRGGVLFSAKKGTKAATATTHRALGRALKDAMIESDKAPKCSGWTGFVDCDTVFVDWSSLNDVVY